MASGVSCIDCSGCVIVAVTIAERCTVVIAAFPVVQRTQLAHSPASVRPLRCAASLAGRSERASPTPPDTHSSVRIGLCAQPGTSHPSLPSPSPLPFPSATVDHCSHPLFAQLADLVSPPAAAACHCTPSARRLLLPFAGVAGDKAWNNNGREQGRPGEGSSSRHHHHRHCSTWRHARRPEQRQLAAAATRPARGRSARMQWLEQREEGGRR